MSNQLKPEILCHPNIPKPMHGVAPREIMGPEWWDAERKKVYASTDYHCAACGVHKTHAKQYRWLEAHEFWHIDYATGICEISSIEPLCHYCHNFIHSSRLKLLIGKNKSVFDVKQILEHGFKILAKHQLQCFLATRLLAKELGCDTYNVTAYPLPEKVAEWPEWRLIWNGNEYRGKFKSLEEWADHYSIPHT